MSERLPLPFLDRDEIRAFVHYGGDVVKQISPLALGIAPFFVAFLLVECVAVVTPRLRRLRHGSATERAQLTRAAWVVAVLLAAAQGWAAATYMQTLRGPSGYPLLDYGLESVLGVAAALVLGTISAGLVAVLVSRHGLGNGFAVFFGVAALESLVGSSRSMLAQPREAWTDASLLFGLTLLVIVPLVVVRLRSKAPGLRVPIPTCGLIPVQLTGAILLFPATLAASFPVLAPLAKELRLATNVRTAAGPFLAAALAVFLSRVFCPSHAVIRAFQRSRPRAYKGEGAAGVERALSVANRYSAALVVGLVLLPTVATWLGAPVLITVSAGYSVALLIAIALDLVDEAKARAGVGALVTARVLHRAYAVEPALLALADAGITGFARTLRYRTLFHAFAPYAPIEILVPPERAAEADAICARIVSDVPVNDA
jgi:preprotein translocase subunit SecY